MPTVWRFIRHGILVVLFLAAAVLLGAGATSRYYEGYWFRCDECSVRSLLDVAEVREVGWATYLIEEGRFEHDPSMLVPDLADWWDRCSAQGLAQLREAGLSLPPAGSPVDIAAYEAAFEQFSPELLKAARDSPYLKLGREQVGRRANIHGWLYRVRTRAGDDVLAWELWAITAHDHQLHEIGMVSGGRLLESRHFVVLDWPIALYGGGAGLMFGCLIAGLFPQLLRALGTSIGRS